MDVGAAEHAFVDGHHVVGDRQVRRLARITRKRAVFADDEIVVIGLLRTHVDGCGLLLARRVLNRGGNVGVARLALRRQRHAVAHLLELAIGLLHLHHGLVAAGPGNALAGETIRHQRAHVNRAVKQQVRIFLRQHHAHGVGHFLNVHGCLCRNLGVVSHGHGYLGRALGHAFQLTVFVNFHHVLV